MSDWKIVEDTNKSAQRFMSNTVASIALPVPEHISTTYNNLRGRRGGARGGEMAFATMNASPPRISSALKSEKISSCLMEEIMALCCWFVEF